MQMLSCKVARSGLKGISGASGVLQKTGCCLMPSSLKSVKIVEGQDFGSASLSRISAINISR